MLTPFDHRKLAFLPPAPHVFLRTPEDSFPALPPAMLSPLKLPQPPPGAAFSSPYPSRWARTCPSIPHQDRQEQTVTIRFLPKVEAKGIIAHPKTNNTPRWMSGVLTGCHSA